MIYKNKNEFGFYLAGLWEGDGSLRMAKNIKPSINITFHSKDALFAEKLLSILNDLNLDRGSSKSPCKKEKVGSLFYHKKQNACYLTIYSVTGLKHFIYLVNGKLRTPKAYQIGFVIRWLNSKYSTDIRELPMERGLQVSEDAWLAGFIDADGSFAIRQTVGEEVVKRQTECRFILCQRQIYPKTGQSYEKLFKAIANFLEIKLSELKACNFNALDQFRIMASKKSKKISRVYLDKFPLLTSKRLDYEAWCCADNLMIQNLHYTEQGQKTIRVLKKSMNHSRMDYNWDYLNQF